MFITGLAQSAALNELKNKIPNVNNLVKKQAMMQKYQMLGLNILPRLIIINLQNETLNAKIKKKD